MKKIFIKELKAQKKTLCVRGKAIEGEVAKAIYEDDCKIRKEKDENTEEN